MNYIINPKDDSIVTTKNNDWSLVENNLPNSWKKIGHIALAHQQNASPCFSSLCMVGSIMMSSRNFLTSLWKAL